MIDVIILKRKLYQINGSKLRCLFRSLVILIIVIFVRPKHLWPVRRYNPERCLSLLAMHGPSDTMFA